MVLICYKSIATMVKKKRIMENTNGGEGPHGNNAVEPNVKSLFTILNDDKSMREGWDNCYILDILAMS